MTIEKTLDRIADALEIIASNFHTVVESQAEAQPVATEQVVACGIKIGAVSIPKAIMTSGTEGSFATQLDTEPQPVAAEQPVSAEEILEGIPSFFDKYVAETPKQMPVIESKEAPKRKRRTKAEIEAEAAVKGPAQTPVEGEATEAAVEVGNTLSMDALRDLFMQKLPVALAKTKGALSETEFASFCYSIETNTPPVDAKVTAEYNAIRQEVQKIVTEQFGFTSGLREYASKPQEYTALINHVKGIVDGSAQ